MKYFVEKKSAQSAYMQLYLQLRKDITEGVLPYGAKLPSKRTLAAETDTSVITVEHAYGILAEEGYVETRERSGYFVMYRKYNVVPVSEEAPEFLPRSNVVQGEDDFPFSVFAKTTRTVLSQYGEQILIKSPNFGCEELRNSIASYLGRSKGMYVRKEQIVVGSGAEYLYGLIVQFLGRNRVYALENPSYEKIRAVYETNGAVCDMLSMGTEGIISEELQRTKASVLHVTPFHSFPSSVTASASKRNEYVAWAKGRNGIIVEDDFDSEFTVSSKHEDTIFSLEPQNSVFYVNTFTKTVAPSMRVGYMVLPEHITKSFHEKMGFYSCTVPVLEQLILAELLRNGDFERHINRIRRKRRKSENHM